MKNRRNTNLWLLLGLLVLLVSIWFATSMYQKNEYRNFESGFPVIDVFEIDTLRIYSAAERGAEITLYRKHENWRVRRGPIDKPLHEGRIEVLFEELHKLRATRMAALTKSDWPRFGMEDSSSTRIVAAGKNGVIIDFVAGRFDYYEDGKAISRDNRTATRDHGITHVRLTGREEVYSADNFFGPNFNQRFETWRSQKIVAIDMNELQKIFFRYSETDTFTIKTNNTDGWICKGRTINPEKQFQYMTLLSRGNHFYFADSFVIDREPLFTVKYYLTENKVITVDAYEANSGQIILHSSENPETFFLDYKDTLLDMYFPPMDFFFSEPEF